MEMRFQLERQKYEPEIRYLKNKLRGGRMLAFKALLKKLHLCIAKQLLVPLVGQSIRMQGVFDLCLG